MLPIGPSLDSELDAECSAASFFVRASQGRGHGVLSEGEGLPIQRVAILGPGLLGGSIALGLRERCAEVEVRMWGRRAEVLEESKALGMASVASEDVCEVVDGADTVVLCVPVGAMEALVEKALPALGRDALVTDVGSVKRCVVERLAPRLEGRALFVGSHPMAGSERAGLGAARSDLFQGAVCILTPEEGRTQPEAYRRAAGFWGALGCRVRALTPEQHDAVCAHISHVPHVVAAALVNAVNAAKPEAFGFVGAGFRDTTRVAGGLPEMWTEILTSNRKAVAEGVRGLIAELERVVQGLEEEPPRECDARKLHAFLAAAKEQRDRLQQG